MIFRKQKLIKYKDELYCDLRSDEVALCRQKKQDARIIVGDEYIDILFRNLRWGKKITKEEFQMKYPPYEKYTLLSYKWTNPQKMTELQIKLN